MKCPTDNTDLVMADRQGVEIDYCPKCRGVWLDRGELDKIIDRALTEAPVAAAPPAGPAMPPPAGRQQYPHGYYQGGEGNEGGEGGEGYNRPYRRRKSILSDIFDF